jgi:hypothetical protein
MERPDGTIYTIYRKFGPFDKPTSRPSTIGTTTSTARKRPSRTPSPAPQQQPWTKPDYADGTSIPTTKSTQYKHSRGTSPTALSGSHPGSRHHTPKSTEAMSSKTARPFSDTDPHSEANCSCLPLNGFGNSSETTSDLPSRPHRSRNSRADTSTHSSDADISSGARSKSLKDGGSKAKNKETEKRSPPSASTYRRRYRGYLV